jgi:hypothetical protein
MELNKKQLALAKKFAQLSKKKGDYPSNPELLSAGVTRNTYRHHFGSFEQFKAAAREAFPKSFEKLDQAIIEATAPKEPHAHSDFTKEAIGSIIKENDFKEGTFFITGVSPTSYLDWSEQDHVRAENGEDVLAENLFEPAFAAMENYLKRSKAELVLLPMPAHVKALQKQPNHYDPKLKPFIKKFATEYTFNVHLKAIEAHLNPQQANPITGLRRLRVHKYTGNYEQGQEIKRAKTSLIIGHSKQMMEVSPTGNASHPRIVHSTGCITKGSYLRNRVGMIANEDHMLGGLIVEVRGDTFWIRQVQFDVFNGSFIDLGKRYHADGSMTDERAEAFKMGDIHPGHHDQTALEGMYQLWDEIKPKRIYFEDFFDGTSISHHLEKKKLTQAIIARDYKFFADLPSEIAYAKQVLESVWAHAPKDAKLIATASNHPEHVMRYIEESRYIKDNVPNCVIGHEMFLEGYKGLNPLQLRMDPGLRMIWSEENADDYVEGVQMNVHGHLGINGMRGGKAGHELAHGDVMAAHSHTPSIYHGCFTVGHMTHERHGYNQGPSTWILCCGAVYKGGMKQLYMIIKGSAFRPRGKKKAA